MWGQLFLFFSAICCLYFVVKRIPLQKFDLKIILILSILIWMTSQFFNTGDIILVDEMISDLLQITIVSLVLTALMVIVRNLRPAIFRYPYFLIYSPLAIPLFFLLVIDTYFIKDLIIMTTQGIAITVYLLLLTEDQAIAHKKRYGLAGIFLILLALISFWFLQDLLNLHAITWELSFSIGILFITDAFTKIKED